jgi:hypothetical protein
VADEQDPGGVIFKVLMAVVTGVVAWLARRVVDDREEIVVLKGKFETLEAKHEEVKKDQITQECVREVVEEALERRDKQAEVRRAEWDRRFSLEVKAAVQEELDKLTPKLIREIRAATGRHYPSAGAD